MNFLTYDVAPVLRRFLTRADDCFDDRLSLTLCDELVRGQVPKRAVRSTLIIVHAPGFDEGLRLGQRGELMHVQALITESPVKRFNEGIFHRFARSNEVELDASPIRPILQGARLEFCPMIHRDRAGHRRCVQYTIKHLPDRLSRHPKPCL